MRWLETSFVLPRGWVDPWSDWLLEHGAVSVSAEDADADSLDEQPQYGEPGMPLPAIGWEHTRLLVLTEGSINAGDLIARCAMAFQQMPPADVIKRRFDDEDWVRRTQSQFEPILIQSPSGKQLWIRPSWRVENNLPASDQALGMVLDPGLAFGTGSHPTTHLCLAWLLDHAPQGRTVIDYGCGSGILAIAAAQLGAGQVTGVDIDPQALKATLYNASVNKVHISTLGSDQQAPPPADVVLANILASPLKVLADLLQQLTKPGGYLVLSGLLERQIDEIVACYPQVQLSVVAIEQGWACLAGHKSG
jgi:ribosomal protein L11 methyltransferase